MLAIEANDVIGLRLLKLAGGDQAALDEAQLMLSEKVDAAFEAGAGLGAGGTFEAMINRYREHVTANRTRLLAA